MHTPNFLRRAMASLVKHTWLLPQTVSLAVRQRREQQVLDEIEAERLDRLRNPSKYRGK